MAILEIPEPDHQRLLYRHRRHPEQDQLQRIYNPRIYNPNQPVPDAPEDFVRRVAFQIFQECLAHTTDQTAYPTIDLAQVWIDFTQRETHFALERSLQEFVREGVTMFSDQERHRMYFQTREAILDAVFDRAFQLFMRQDSMHRTYQQRIFVARNRRGWETTPEDAPPEMIKMTASNGPHLMADLRSNIPADRLVHPDAHVASTVAFSAMTPAVVSL